MTPIAEMVAKMLASETPHEAIILAIETAEKCILVRGHSADVSADISAERRRQADRERKRLKRLSAEIPQNSADSAECPMSASTLTSPHRESLKEESKSRGRASRLSADWKPDTAAISFALEHGFDLATINLESLKFLNYWTSKSGRDATKLDWGRTWQNWILNARKPNGNQNGKSSAKTVADVGREVVERLSRETGEHDDWLLSQIGRQ